MCASPLFIVGIGVGLALVPVVFFGTVACCGIYGMFWCGKKAVSQDLLYALMGPYYTLGKYDKWNSKHCNQWKLLTSFKKPETPQKPKKSDCRSKANAYSAFEHLEFYRIL